MFSAPPKERTSAPVLSSAFTSKQFGLALTLSTPEM